MKRIIDFVALNKFSYRVKKSESIVFFDIVPNLTFSIKSPENGPHKLLIHKAILKRFYLEDHLVLESKNQDEILEKTIKILKYPHLLKRELRSNFEKFMRMEDMSI